MRSLALHHLCTPHRRGVDPTKPLTFAPECSRCREMLDAGKRTGDEPHPSTVYLRWPKRPRIAPARFGEVQRYFAAKRAAAMAVPLPRRGA